MNSTFSGACLEGQNCLHEVGDTTYSESFTAVPRPGWVFEKWYAAEGFNCDDSTNPTCTVSFGTLAGNADIDAIVASADMRYIMPVFRETTTEPPDTTHQRRAVMPKSTDLRTSERSHSVSFTPSTSGRVRAVFAQERCCTPG